MESLVYIVRYAMNTPFSPLPPCAVTEVKNTVREIPADCKELAAANWMSEMMQQDLQEVKEGKKVEGMTEQDVKDKVDKWKGRAEQNFKAADRR